MSLENVKNCSECNGIYVQKTSVEICEKCYLKEQEVFNKVKLYISKSKNKDATMEDILNSTGAFEKKVIKWVKEGRISTRHLVNFSYNCELCSTPTREGRLCSSCKNEIINSAAIDKNETRQLRVHVKQ